MVLLLSSGRMILLMADLFLSNTFSPSCVPIHILFSLSSARQVMLLFVSTSPLRMSDLNTVIRAPS